MNITPDLISKTKILIVPMGKIIISVEDGGQKERDFIQDLLTKGKVVPDMSNNKGEGWVGIKISARHNV